MPGAHRRGTHRKTARRLWHERLESRQLLAGDLLISELMARNDNTLDDEDGDSSDWLEIFNSGDAPINTAGWFVTDDPNNLTKWQLPGDNLAVGQYRLIFASGKDRATGGQWHTNFQLNGGGEYLALVMPDGTTVASEFAPAFPTQAVDVSYGVDESDPAQKWYFEVATPGAANDLSRTFDGVVEDTQFSVDRGFFDAPFDVEITTLTPDAEIRYTLDGSTPGARSPLYSSPISITTTSTLRAVAMKPDFLSTNVDTQTYIFVEDVIRQPNDPAGFPTTWGSAPAVDYEMDPAVVDNRAYTQDLLDGLRAIPSLSLVMSVDDMFGPLGLYSNPRDPDLEKATSAELILPDGSTGFQIDAGLKIQGGASRRPDRSPKHSMSLRFRDIYGPGRLDYPVFEDSPVTNFDSLQLRAMYNNSWIHWSESQRPRGSLIRDQWMRDSLLEMGQIDAGRGTYFHVYLNGLYWGVYNVHERQDSAHYADYFGGSEDDYDARNGSNVIDGTSASYNAMKATVASRDWEAIQQVLDVDNYIDFTIIQRFGGNQDLQNGGNWRSAGGGPNNAPWRFYSWDAERVLENVGETNVVPSSDPPAILNDLQQIPQFVSRFADRLQKHFFNGGALTPEATAARWQVRADVLHDAIVAESARWGDYRRDVHPSQCGCALYTRDAHWLPEQNRLMNSYFPGRGNNVINQFRSMGLFSSLDAPVFNQHGGQVESGFEVSLSGTGTLYYTLDGSDPRAGDATVQQTTLLPEFAPATALVPTDGSLGDSWQLLGFDDSSWTGGTGGVGYERNTGYDPLIGIDIEADMFDENETAYVRVPFEAEDPATFDTLTLRMKYDDGFVAYLNGVLVAQRNDPNDLDWQAGADDTHSDSAAVVFENFDISEFLHALRPGDNMLAIHGLNAGNRSSDFLILPEIVAGVTSDTGLSPSAIEFTAPFALNTSAVVRARALSGERWSPLVEATFIVDSSPVRITELMYHPADPPAGSQFVGNDFEFLELLNLDSAAVDLTGLRLSDGVQFDFADSAITSLDPGEHVLVVSNQAAFESRYGAGHPIAGEYTGQLSNGGEHILLEDAFGTPVLSFSYDDAWYPETDGDGHSLVIVDPRIDPAAWGQMASWRASHLVGGSPGAIDVDRIPGDANGDGRVDIADLNAVRNHFGEIGAGIEGDANGDGRVDIADLNAVRNNFGNSAPAAITTSATKFRAASARPSAAANTPHEAEPTLSRESRRISRRLARASRGHIVQRAEPAQVWDRALIRFLAERPA